MGATRFRVLVKGAAEAELQLPARYRLSTPNRAASKSWCKAPRLATMDSRLHGNDDGQSAYWTHVIPAKAGIHLPYMWSLHEDFDATLALLSACIAGFFHGIYAAWLLRRGNL